MTAGDLLEPDVDPLTAPVGTEFVIQQHHATRLHHDVRLEMMSGDGPVLVSWAVPKGLPRRRGDRHLAIRTPDHEMEWGSFSGSIGKGRRGWARCESSTTATTSRRPTEDRLTFQLNGERLAGVWHLVHTGPKDGKDQWLAIDVEGPSCARRGATSGEADAGHPHRRGVRRPAMGFRAEVGRDPGHRPLRRGDPSRHPQRQRRHGCLPGALVDCTSRWWPWRRCSTGRSSPSKPACPRSSGFSSGCISETNGKIEEMARQIPGGLHRVRHALHRR